MLKCVALPASERTSGVVCCICPNRLMRVLAAHASRDQRQHFGEHLWRRRDLAHLDGYMRRWLAHQRGARLTSTEYSAGVTALGALRSIQLGHGPRRCARLQRKLSRYPKLNFLRSDVAAHFILSYANKWWISLP